MNGLNDALILVLGTKVDKEIRERERGNVNIRTIVFRKDVELYYTKLKRNEPILYTFTLCPFHLKIGIYILYIPHKLPIPSIYYFIKESTL